MMKILFCCYCQGPALYVYNNAEFTKEDWAGIISPRVGSEKKKSPEKVGKFGLGFSSVYHLTGQTETEIQPGRGLY